MLILPLKERYHLSEKDINDLSRLLAEGSSLAHMEYFFQGRLTAAQIYSAAGVIANYMYESTLEELCPHLKEERGALNREASQEWGRKKRDTNVIALLKEAAEDLVLYEQELLTQVRV